MSGGAVDRCPPAMCPWTARPHILRTNPTLPAHGPELSASFIAPPTDTTRRQARPQLPRSKDTAASDTVGRGVKRRTISTTFATSFRMARYPAASPKGTDAHYVPAPSPLSPQKLTPSESSTAGSQSTQIAAMMQAPPSRQPPCSGTDSTLGAAIHPEPRLQPHNPEWPQQGKPPIARHTHLSRTVRAQT